MIAYVLLSVLLLALFLGSLRITGNMLLSPVPLALLGLLVSIVLAAIGLMSWNQVSLGYESVCVVALGAASLLAGGFFMSRLLEGRGDKSSEKAVSLSTHVTPAWKYVLMAAILILAIVVRIVETYRIGAELGADLSSYAAAAKAVRNSLSGIMSSEGMLPGAGFSLIERQLEKVAAVSGYVSAYLLARSIVGKRRVESTLSAVLLFLSCLFCIVTGGRTAILLYCIAFAVAIFVCLVQGGHSPLRLTVCFFVIGVVACVIAAVGFYAASSLIGRPASSGPVEYISFYFGCGAPTLQQFLDSGDVSTLVPGIRTFYYLFSVPYKLGLIDAYPSYSIAWVDMGGHASNVFTGFARYYLDFGLIGVAALSALAGAFMTFIYKVAARGGNPFLVVFAGYLCAYSFDLAREEFVFSRLLSPTQLVSVAIMLVVTVFLTTSLREDYRRARTLLFQRKAA